MTVSGIPISAKVLDRQRRQRLAPTIEFYCEVNNELLWNFVGMSSLEAIEPSDYFSGVGEVWKNKIRTIFV